MLGPMLKFCLCLADLVSMLDCLSMFIMSTILFHIHFHSSWHLFCFGLIGLSWVGMGRTDHGLLPWLSCLHVIRVKISVTTAWGGFMHLASFIGSHVCAKSRLSPDWLLDFAPCDPSGCWPSV